jgi:predicted dehydrogenase
MDLRTFMIVGTGNRGMFFAKSLLGWPDKGLPEFPQRAQLVALADRNLARAQASKNELLRRPLPNELPLFRDLAEAVQQTRPDWAVVTVPDCAHADVCCRLLDLGVNVLVEKPLATSVQECRQIVDKAKAVGREVRVAHNYRHMRWVLRAEALVRAGRIGRVLSVEAAEILGNDHGADYFHRWHADFRNSGGMLIQKACHHFDLINWILRDKPVSVSAMGSRTLYVGRPDLDHASRCDDCQRKKSCVYAKDLDVWGGLHRRMYRDSEHEDGYIRDRCVFDDTHTIYDNYHVNLQFAKGVIGTYTLTNFGPREYVFANFTGTEGCIEAGHDRLTEKEHVRLILNNGKVEEFITDDEGGMDGHGGADLRMVAAFLGFRDKDVNPESLSTAEEATQAVMGADLGNRSLARGGVPVWADEAGRDLPPPPPGKSWADGVRKG